MFWFHRVAHPAAAPEEQTQQDITHPPIKCMPIYFHVYKPTTHPKSILFLYTRKKHLWKSSTFHYKLSKEAALRIILKRCHKRVKASGSLCEQSNPDNKRQMLQVCAKDSNTVCNRILELTATFALQFLTVTLQNTAGQQHNESTNILQRMQLQWGTCSVSH